MFAVIFEQVVCVDVGELVIGLFDRWVRCMRLVVRCLVPRRQDPGRRFPTNHLLVERVRRSRLRRVEADRLHSQR